jgi:hypothetical protein
MSTIHFDQCAADVEEAAEQREIHRRELQEERESNVVFAAKKTTQLTVIERAQVACGSAEHEIALINLAEGSKAISVITNADGYKECHATRMTLKTARLKVTKTSKEARDDATAFSKSVIAEEKRLIAIIAPDEDRLEALQTDWDAAQEAEKQRKIDEEAARVERIKTRIEAIRRIPLESVGKSYGLVANAIDFVTEIVIDDSYAEHQAYAILVKQDALAALASLLAAAVAQEAEQARALAEREELAQMRETQRIADEARAENLHKQALAEAERLSHERAEAQRREFAARDELAKKQAETDRLTKELADLKKSNEMRIASEQAAETLRIENEKRAAQQEEGAEEQRRLDRANLTAQSVAQQEGEARINQSIPDLVPVSGITSIDRPSDEEIIAVIADRFDVSNATSLEWITSIATFHQFTAELRAA